VQYNKYRVYSTSAPLLILHLSLTHPGFSSVYAAEYAWVGVGVWVWALGEESQSTDEWGGSVGVLANAVSKANHTIAVPTGSLRGRYRCSQSQQLV
jgi:hypothetical protein